MYGNTAIMKAGYWGKFDVLKYLILMGANLEAQNDDGMTALILTAKDNKIECVKFLLERGASMRAKSFHGCTPLIASSENGHLEVVQLLVEKGQVFLDDQVNHNSLPHPSTHLFICDILSLKLFLKLLLTSPSTPYHITSYPLAHAISLNPHIIYTFYVYQ